MLINNNKIMIVLVTVFVMMTYDTDAFGHGNPGVDRAPAIDFENKNVTVEARMNPADMTVGNFSNAFMSIAFLNYDTDELFRQSTYMVDIFKQEKLLARNLFYADDGKITIDIRPNNDCSVLEENPWNCTTYYGTKHGITGGLYTFGQSNPVINGAIFTDGGLYHIKVEVIGAGSVHSSLLNPLKFDLYVTIAQEQIFWLDLETGETFDKPKHLR